MLQGRYRQTKYMYVQLRYLSVQRYNKAQIQTFPDGAQYITIYCKTYRPLRTMRKTTHSSGCGTAIQARKGLGTITKRRVDLVRPVFHHPVPVLHVRGYPSPVSTSRGGVEGQHVVIFVSAFAESGQPIEGKSVMDEWDCLSLLLRWMDSFGALRPYAMPIMQRALGAEDIPTGGHRQTRGGGENVAEDTVNEDERGEGVDYIGNLHRDGLSER